MAATPCERLPCRMAGDWRTEETLLFQDDADRARFRDRLAEHVEQYHIAALVLIRCGAKTSARWLQ